MSKLTNNDKQNNHEGIGEKLNDTYARSISKEVLQRAKIARINFKEVSEQILKRIPSLLSNGNTTEDVARTYILLFENIQEVLRSFRGSIVVGLRENHTKPTERGEGIIQLSHSGSELIIYCNGNTVELVPLGVDNICNIMRYFYDTVKILENLFIEITEAAERSMKNLRSIKLALDCVKIIAEEQN